MWWPIGSAINLFLYIVVMTVYMRSDKYDAWDRFPIVMFGLFLTAAWPVVYTLAAFVAPAVLLGRWVDKKWFNKETK